MKKKKQNRVGETCGPEGMDLKSLIHEHSLFFDRLVDLIPAKFYLPTDENEKVWFQGLSKKEKAVLKVESRENIKKARRDRLDPEKSAATTRDLLLRNIGKEKEKMKEDSGGENAEIGPVMPGLEDGERTVTYEELRLRLRRKIEELRAGRNANDSEAKKSDKERKGKGVVQKKRKREPEEKKPVVTGSVVNVEKDVAEAAKELKFSHVKMGNEEEQGRKKKKKLSKLKELENAKKLEEEKKDPEKAKKHLWSAAVQRAAGKKVHDNPKLLEQSLKKEKKRQQKNAKNWKERIENQQKSMAEKQQKRSDNITEKINQKKQRRIEKREKKLMRVGFEGRKEGYINEETTTETHILQN